MLATIEQACAEHPTLRRRTLDAEMELAQGPVVRPGDHACCVFDTDDLQAKVVEHFARKAFARGERFFYLADRADAHAVVDVLEDANLDGRDRLDAGALVVLHSSQMRLDDGFDRDRQMRVWAELVAQARADGYAGLAVAAEMTWALSWQVPLDLLLEYEATAESAFAGGRMSAVCLYDSRAFDADFLRSARHAHPLAASVHESTCKIDGGQMHVERQFADHALALAGEVDLANVALLEAELAEDLANGDLSMDCSALRFVDLAGVRLLRRACLGELGAGRLSLQDAPPVLTRLMKLCDWADAG